MKFIHNGSFYQQSPLRKYYLSLKAYFMGIKFFVRIMMNYPTSVVGNELTISQAWQLAHSHQDTKIGRTCQIEW